jgi:hypothetical protein
MCSCQGISSWLGLAASIMIAPQGPSSSSLRLLFSRCWQGLLISLDSWGPYLDMRFGLILLGSIKSTVELSDGLGSDETMNWVFETSSTLIDRWP